MGTSGIVISRDRSALPSSHIAIATMTPMRTRKVDLTVNRVRMTRPPRPRPPPAATGRLRPVLELRGCGTLVTSGAGSWRSKLDLEELGFLVLEQLVYLADVPGRQLVELALGPAHVVLPRVAVLGELVERVLRVP